MQIKRIGRTPMLGKTHSKETRNKMREAHLGLKHSDASRLKMRISHKSHMERCNNTCKKASCSKNNPSNLAWKAYELLLHDFEVVIPEAKFGRYQVDFLLAEEWIGVEIDGTYWHKDRDHFERDEYLLREHGLPIVRITEEEVEAD